VGILEKRVNEKFVRSFLDVIAVTILNNRPTYGYEIISTVHKKFGVLLSPGTLYPLLHSLEDNGFIESSHNSGKIIYSTTPKGEQKFKSTLNTFNLAVEKMSSFIEEHKEEIVLPV